MKKQGQTPLENDTQKAAEQTQRAVDKVVQAEKSREDFATEQGQRDAAHSLKRNAEKDTGKPAT
jgi:hypothetical protein